MNAEALAAEFDELTTAHVADACLRRGVAVRCAPSELRPLDASRCRVVGRARPARHAGSVDVFLEAIAQAQPGDVLVVDNTGRRDEACVGDLVALEAKTAGLAALVIWGLHRDRPELLDIGLPVWSLGTLPTGPLRLDPRDVDALGSARVGPWVVTAEDVVMADDDGVLFVPLARVRDIATAAWPIRDTERAQAARMREGTTLRAQLRFDEFIARR
jgi:regulator of RNase E activity RraA